MVEYKIGEVETELAKQLQPGKRRIVLVAHDESTMKANDSEKEGWVMDGEQPLKNKGAGRGLHQSDIICSTYGWLKGASVTMEYGKNYEGYWTGELFVKQVSELILQTYYHSQTSCSFARRSFLSLKDCMAPNIRYQALITVDNSQGHTAYASDALLATKMNLNPRGAVPKL